MSVLRFLFESVIALGLIMIGGFFLMIIKVMFVFLKERWN
jgi:hypothetical protein